MSRKPTLRRFRALAALLAAGVPFAASASEPGPAPSQPAAPMTEGELIYARDVRHSIGAQYFPKQAHAVITAPTQLIVNTVDLGLAPLSDRETAAVTGSLQQVVAATAQLSSPLVGAGSLAPGSDVLAPGQSAAGSTGGVIGQAMGALSNALGSLSVLTGGRP